MRIIARSDVERLLPVSACVEIMRGAMIATSRRDVTLPIRQFMPVPDSSGKLAIMPGTLGNPACFGIKLVCKYDRPHDDPLGTHVGMVLLFDSVKGIPLAMIEGSLLTSIRTSAASALATDLLARPDATKLAIIGNGEQARRHLAAMRAVRAISSVTVWGRNLLRTQRFADEMTNTYEIAVIACEAATQAVMDADIICTTTSAKSPVLMGAEIPAGAHLNLVGSAIPTTAEVDDEAVLRSRFFVDYRDAAMAAAGELLHAIESGVVTADHIAGEIGQVADGSVTGRRSNAEITIYKSLGVASQDLAAAHAVWSMAEAEDAGTKIELMN
jgi:ornithine cyclodeaminase/alanine dehydrogenase-like protein (mu-crystallin family)